MKYSIIFLFFLYGCMSPKKAEKQLNKLQIKYPEVVAKKNAIWNPCKPFKLVSDSSAYKLYIQKLDSLNGLYIDNIDTIIVNNTIKSFDTIIKDCPTILNKYRKVIYNVPIIHDTIKILDMSQINALKYELENCNAESKKYHIKYEKSLWWVICLFIILLAFALYEKFKK